MYWASLKGHLEVVRALLDAKAEVNKAASGGRTPLSKALSNNHPEVAAFLRDAGANEKLQPLPTSPVSLHVHSL